MASLYANKIVMGNGKTMTRPAGTTDSEWNTLVKGYISRFGVLQSGDLSKATTAPKTTTTVPKTTTRATSTGERTLTGAQQSNLRAQGYTDYQILRYMAGDPLPSTPAQSVTTSAPAQPITAPEISGSTSKVNNTADIQAAMAVLNKYMNEGILDSGTYQFFKKAIELWDPDQEIDYANILNTFEQIKRDEVDPYFKEQAMIFSDQIQRNYKYLLENKKLEDERTKEDTAKLKENMQEDLANRGILFSGEAIKKLGTESPFAQAGTPEAVRSAIPVHFGGIPEGEFQKQVKTAVSSNELRHQKSLEDLQRQAELTLGTAGASGMIAGVTPLGGVTGSMTSQQKQAYGSALTGLYNQSLQNVGYGQNQKVFNE